MPFLSFSTEWIPGRAEDISEKLNPARKKYDDLMPQPSSNPTEPQVAYPVAHGCPTLDEAFYHFAEDQQSQDEARLRNEGQVVWKELKILENSQKTGKHRSSDSGVLSDHSTATSFEEDESEQPHAQTILRVSQLWIWTIGESK